MHKFISQTLRRAASVLATAVLLLQTTMPLVAAASHNQGNGTPPAQEECREVITQYRYKTRTERPDNTVERKFVQGYNFVDGGTVNFQNQSGNPVTVSGHWVVSSGWHQIADSVINAYWGAGGISPSLIGGSESSPQGNVPLSVYGGPNVQVPYYASTETISGGYTDWGPWSDWSNNNPGSSTSTREVESRNGPYGEVIACPTGKITIKKNVRGGTDNQDFTYTTNVPGVQGGKFVLDDDGNDNNSVKRERKFENLALGTSFTFTEEYVAGWQVEDIDCTSGASVQKNGNAVTISLTASKKDVRCEFHNKKIPTGTIKIMKDVKDGKDSQDFTFTTDVPGVAGGQFLLDDDNNGTLSNTKEIKDVPLGTWYTFTENATEDWKLHDISCDTSRDSNINIDESKSQVKIKLTDNRKDITCTFVNKKEPKGKLIVKKNVINDNGGNKTYADFTFKYNNGSAVEFNADNSDQKNEDGVKEIELPAGASFDVKEVEANQFGYSTSYDGQCKGTIEAGKSKTCTITNNDKAPKLTVVKHVVNNDGGKATVNDFGLKINGNGMDFGSPVTTGYTKAYTAEPTVKANQDYTLSEKDTAGYTEGKWFCDDGTKGTGLSVTINLELGEEVKCEVINDDDRANIIVNKVVGNYWGGTALPDDFVLKVNGGVTTSGLPLSVAAGSYYISEEQLAGYELSKVEGDCYIHDGKIKLHASNGGNYTCTLFNKDKPGSIKLYKKVVNDDGGDKKARNFDLYANGYKFDSGDKKYLKAGEYKIWEEKVNGYEQKSIKCYVKKYNWANEDKLVNWGYENGWEKVSYYKFGWTKVNLQLDQDVVCVIVNDDIAPKVTVKKVAYGGHGWEKFEFKLDQHGNSHDKHFWLGNMQSKTFEVKPGLVQVFEKNLPSNWGLTGDSCLERKHGQWVPMGAGTDFIAVLGGEYKCTFTNDKDGEVHGHKFNDRNANGKWDKGEEGLKDWTINLYQKTCQPRNNTTAANDDNPLMKVNKDRYIPLVDCSFDEKPYMTTTTKWNGSYKFTGVDLNRWYKVCEVQQDGWTQTKPNPDWFDGCYFIYVDRKSRVHVHKNFGNVEHVIEVELTPVCEAGFPYLNWKVTAHHFTPTQFTFDWYTNPGNVHVPGATTSVMANDSSVTKNGNVYTGSILWPGANPVLPDWPGWTFTNGKWVEDPSDFGGNLRPNAKVMVSVNPSTTAEVAYPPAESGCDPTNPQVLGTDTLANTGSPALLSIIAALSLVTIASYIVVGRKQN